jgi:hypothetical protein
MLASRAIGILGEFSKGAEIGGPEIGDSENHMGAAKGWNEGRRTVEIGFDEGNACRF